LYESLSYHITYQLKMSQHTKEKIYHSHTIHAPTIYFLMFAQN